MRFPYLKYMDRVIGKEDWALLPYINKRVSEKDQIVQKPYIFTAPNSFRRFNDITAQIKEVDSASASRYDINLFNATFDAQSASDMWNNEIAFLTEALTADFDSGFNLLMKYDSLSVRQFLLEKGYSNSEIDWLETLNDATGHYSTYSMSSAVLEQWIFDSGPPDKWTLINGGMDMITRGMELVVKNKPVLGNRVTAIKKNKDHSLRVSVHDKGEFDYAHVISTVPLGALQVIDMTELDLEYAQKNAIRGLK